MKGFVYFVSGARRTITAAQLAKAGLAHAFEGPFTASECARSPDGKAGVIIADSRVDGPDIGYFPDRQTWLVIPGSDGSWVGLINEAAPGPDELIRKEPLPGMALLLADGRNWIVPIGRGLDDEGGRLVWYQPLPQRLTMDESGRWSPGGVVPRYAGLADLAAAYWNYWEAQARGLEPTEDLSARFDLDGRARAAIEVLAVNYRLGPAEVQLLGLFETTTPTRVLDAFVHAQFAVDFLAKKAAATPSGSDSGPGPAA